MNKIKNIIMSLFIVSISPLLIQCGEFINTVYIQNDMDFDIKVYSRSNGSNIYFASDKYNDSGEYLEDFPSDGSLNYIIIKSSTIHEFYSMLSAGASSSIDYMYEDLADDDKDFYIENMDTNEIILTRENLRNNPLATLVKSGGVEFILILDEYE